MARSWPRLVEKELSEIACERRCCVEEWRGVCASSSSSMLLAGRLRRCDDMVKINGMVTKYWFDAFVSAAMVAMLVDENNGWRRVVKKFVKINKGKFNLIITSSPFIRIESCYLFRMLSRHLYLLLNS